MPVLFTTVPREALGVWLLLGQSWAALGVLDLGLGVTLTRRIAFQMGKSGADPDVALTQESLRDIADLVETGRRLFLILAMVAFLVAFGTGVLTLRNLHLATVPVSTAWAAWGILCLAQALTVWASVWHCLLLGVGYVGWDSLLAAFANAITLLAQIVVTLMGGGLIGLAIVAAIGALAQRFLILTVARRKRPELFLLKGSWQPSLLRNISPVALRAWVTALGSAVIMNSDQFFVAGIEGTNQIPAYRASYIIFANLFMLSVTFAGNSSVFIAQIWQSGAIDRVHRIVYRNLRLGLIIMVVGGSCVLGLGQHLFTVWIGHGNYIGGSVAAIFFATLLLETQSFIIITCSRATEDEPFALWAAGSAVLKIIFSLALGKQFGLPGIALGTLAAQLATNHWFMCYRGLRRLRMSIRSHLRHVVAPVTLLLIANFVTIRALTRILSRRADWIIVGVAFLLSGVILTGSVWSLVLDRYQRQSVVAYPSRLLRTLGFSLS